MKFLILLVALFAVAVARPNEYNSGRPNEYYSGRPVEVKPTRPDVKIDVDEVDVGAEGYKFTVQTSDGSSHVSEGHLKDVGTDHESYVIHGFYTFIDKQGKEHKITYVADEKGFQPSGEDIPVGPH